MAIQQQGGFGFRPQIGGLRRPQIQVPGAGNNFGQGNQGQGGGGPFDMLRQLFASRGGFPGQGQQGQGFGGLLNVAKGIFGGGSPGQGQGLQQLFARMGGQFPGQGQGLSNNPILQQLGGGPGQFFGQGGQGGGVVQGPQPINETFGFDQRPIADFNPTPVSPAQGGFQPQGGFGGGLIQRPQLARPRRAF